MSPSSENFSFHYDLVTGAARVTTPGFARGLELLRQLQAYRPAGATVQPPASFERGEAVLCLASPSWISLFQQRLRGKFGFSKPPGSKHFFDFHSGKERSVPAGNSVPYLGAAGWVFVTPKSGTQPEAAWALAAALSNPKTGRDIVIEPEWGGGVYRRSHLESPGWQAFGLDSGRTERLKEILRETQLHPSLQNPVLRLRIPDEREHQQALLAEVKLALTGGKEPRLALADAARRWQAIDSKQDAKTRLQEYRLSLSLIRGN